MAAPRLETLVLALLAQRLQRWENLLRQQEEGDVTVSPQSSPAAENISSSAESVSIPLEKPPAHWLKHLQSHLPPHHWVEMVRQKAPGLLDGTGHGVLQARQHTPSTQMKPQPVVIPPDTRDSLIAPKREITQFPTADAGESSAPRPANTFSASQPSPPKAPVYPMPGQHRPLPLQVYTSTDHGELRPPAGTVPQPESASPPITSLNVGEISEPAQTVWAEPPRSESSPPSTFTINEALPTSTSAWISENVPTENTYMFPRYEERSPVEARLAPKTEHPTESLVQQVIFNEAENLTHDQAQGQRQESFEGTWPELPKADESLNANEDMFLRNWKRRERLDREQRGVGWSEPLS